MGNVQQRLLAAMSSVNLDQRQLAHELGIAAGTVSAWCKGTKQPGKEHLGRLAKLLGVDVDFLALGNGEVGKKLGC